jgi:hypothetical protein
MGYFSSGFGLQVVLTDEIEMWLLADITQLPIGPLLSTFCTIEWQDDPF